jgi:hypothetical protein
MFIERADPEVIACGREDSPQVAKTHGRIEFDEKASKSAQARALYCILQAFLGVLWRYIGLMLRELLDERLSSAQALSRRS